MRAVFVYYKDKEFHIIDKATDTLFYKINDVLMFNVTYKRYKGIRGWHGILSEEMNKHVIKLLGSTFHRLVYKPKTYCPRYEFNQEIQAKVGSSLRLLDGVEYLQGTCHMDNIKHLLQEWQPERKEYELMGRIPEEDIEFLEVRWITPDERPTEGVNGGDNE